MVSSPPASVVIPAHDESAVISRCLESLVRQGVPGLEVAVVANGCTDDTAAVARRHHHVLPGLTVVAIEEANKIAALNAGDDAVRAFPRIYLDGDIELAPGTLGPLIETLTTDRALVAAPQIVFDTAGAGLVPRMFFAVFSRLPYVRDGLVGLGVYAVSASGRARFGRFPSITADDLFVQEQFPLADRVTTPGSFRVRVPRRTRDLVRVRTRGVQGTRELGEHGLSTHPRGAESVGTGRALVGLVVRRPWLLPHAVVYVAVMVLARRAAGRPTTGWLRDESTRS